MFNIVRKPKGLPWIAIAALTVAVVGATAGLEWAAEPASPLSDKKLSYRDIQLTVHARKALADDTAVGPGNLGVRVQNNVAVLWGPISSEELKKRAVEVVKKVKGVYEVRDADVYVAAALPVVETAALPKPAADPPTHTESASPDPVSGAILSLASRSPVEAAPAPVVVLRAPLPLSGSAPTQTVSQAPPDGGLEAAVDRVRQNNERFRPINYRLEGGVVVVRPADGQAEDVMAFARAVSRVPGLTRIVILSGDAAPPRLQTAP
jgi:BON domain